VLAALWDFMAGRGAQEKTFAELKGEWALDVVPTITTGPTRLAANLLSGAQSAKKFSASDPGHPKPRSRKRTFTFFLAKSENHSL